MQAVQDCETSSKSVLTDTSTRGMRGEPGIHVGTYSQSSSLIDGSYGSEYSTGVGSPDDRQYLSFSSVRCRQQYRASTVHLHTDDFDTDAGLAILLSVLFL